MQKQEKMYGLLFQSRKNPSASTKHRSSVAKDHLDAHNDIQTMKFMQGCYKDRIKAETDLWKSMFYPGKHASS